MYIKCGNEFKRFDKIITKEAECLEIICDNCTLKCSKDHKIRMSDGTDKEAYLINTGDKLYNNEFNESTVIFVDSLGKQQVYTPLNVDGEHYNTVNGLIHHNCSFLGSSQTLISSEAMAKLRAEDPLRYDMNMDLLIYEEPIPGVLYVMGCDCGTGTGGDYSAVQVLKINSRKEMKEVAVYKNNTISPEDFASVIDNICKLYNDAYYIIENQDVGRIVAETLYYELENYQLISTDGPRKPLGTRATKKSKFEACMELKRLANEECIKIVDAETIKQLSKYEEITHGVFRGAKGQHDDLVSALYWACYCTMQREIDLDNCVSDKAVQRQEYTPDLMFTNNNDYWSDF